MASIANCESLPEVVADKALVLLVGRLRETLQGASLLGPQAGFPQPASAHPQRWKRTECGLYVDIMEDINMEVP